MLSLLIAIPTTFAFDSDNVVSSDANSPILETDYYFDANLDNDTGDGSIDNPYRDLTYDRIEDDSIIHLKDGEYNIYYSKTVRNVTIIGQDAEKSIINGNGYTFTVSTSFTLCNVTLMNLKITNNGNLTAIGTIFRDSTSTNGGAIRSQFSSNVYIYNCTFSNNTATKGGAIYKEGGILSISNSTFISNTASDYGGAIYCGHTSDFCVNDTLFSNNQAIRYFGGSIYLVDSDFTALNMIIANSSSNFGGAIMARESNLNMANLTARENRAKYNGGAIYTIYGELYIYESLLQSNQALNGGAIFTDMLDEYECIGNDFTGNFANYTGGAVYDVCSDITLEDNTYTDNHAAFEDDFCLLDVPDTFVGDGNYTLLKFNSTDDGDLPSRYDLRELGLDTPVKHQENGGNCWAFSAIAALETAILKATGVSYDLSEGNMKNLMSLYSEYGWDMDTNNGGFLKMAYGYLTSWLGPVNESDDEYSDSSFLSAVLHSFFHVQNIMFLERSSYTDNDAIKRAIMNYGAVGTSLYMMGKTYQYYTGTNANNHAVAIVGWDDNLAFDGAPGHGGWIVKNSWGPSWGDNGYFYVSYYDVSFAKPGDIGDTFVFVFNDTMRYDKNYQYDLPGETDYFLNFTSDVWYKNKFVSTDDEYLVAVSTQFNKQTNWDLAVYVNDELKLTQSGFSLPGYYTISLNQLIPLMEGDEFEVEFKITVDGDAGVPISESVSLNCEFYQPGVSFISYDGENWTDFYDLEWTYPDHIYNSQVACIKAFTILNEITTTLTLTAEYNGTNPVNIIASVCDDEGNPVCNYKVDFYLDGEIISVDVTNGVAGLTYNFNNFTNNVYALFRGTGYVASFDSCVINISKSVADLTLDVSRYVNDVVLNIHSSYPVNDVATLKINNDIYPVLLTNGEGSLALNNLENGLYTVNVTLSDDCIYKGSLADSFTVDVKNASIFADDLVTSDIEMFTYSALLLDEDLNPIGSKTVIFTLNGVTYNKTTDSKGRASITTRLDSGNYSIDMAFFGNDYFPCLISKNILVKPHVDFTIDYTTYLNTVSFDISTSIAVNDTFVIKIDNVIYESDDGHLTIDYLDNGKYVLELSLLDGSAYDYNPFYYNFTVDVQTPVIIAGDFNTSYLSNATYMIVVVDVDSNPVGDIDVKFTFNGQTTYAKTNAKGQAFVYINLVNGVYILEIATLENSRYYSVNVVRTILVNSTIILDNPVKAANSNYVIRLLDVDNNPLANATAEIVYGGVSYSLNSDKDGYVYLKVSKVGTFAMNILNTFSGEVLSTSVKVVSRITQNKAVTMYYGAGKSYSVRVCNDNGAFEKGLKVTFKLNGKTYTRTTDANGYASLKISLKPGKYTVVASYGGSSVSNKITVKTTIITKNIIVKKGKTIKFNAKLLNSKGKILKNKFVTFKFKGKTYKVKTDSKGIATLKLNNPYKVGTYNIYTKYGSLTVKNNIKIRK